MSGQKVASGKLYPCDGIGGCTYEVFLKDNGKYDAILTSPYEGCGTVDSVEDLTCQEVFVWLMDRCDW